MVPDFMLNRAAVFNVIQFLQCEKFLIYITNPCTYNSHLFTATSFGGIPPFLGSP